MRRVCEERNEACVSVEDERRECWCEGGKIEACVYVKRGGTGRVGG